MMALVESYKAGLFKLSHWLPNVFSGLIVGIVALPLAMAFAIAAGARPEQGIFTAIIAGMVVAIFGGSRVQIAGPTGAFIVILSSIVAKFGVEGLQLATLMAGILLVIMGFFRLGNIIKFIPYPVIVGFTSAIAIIIFVGQWKDFLGLHFPKKTLFFLHEQIYAVIINFSALHLATALLGLFSLTVMIGINHIKLFRKVPAPLITIVLATLLQVSFTFEGVATIGSTFGAIPSRLPSFHLPSFSYEKLYLLLGPACSIAFLGAIESLLSAVIADGMNGTRHHSNQELIGQGLANIVCPLFGGFAATGAIARTVTNIRHGGTSPLSGIVHSLFLILCILVLAPLTSCIPLCTLSAVLFVVAYNMSEMHHFTFLLTKGLRSDVVVLLATFFLTLFADLIIAINIGVILSVLFFVRRMSYSIQVVKETEEKLQAEFSPHKITNLSPNTLVYSIQGPFFFGALEILQQALHLAHQDPKCIIFRLKNVPFIDGSGLKFFKDVIQTYQSRQIRVYLCEASMQVEQKLLKSGLLSIITDKKVYASCESLIRNLDN